MPDISYFDSMSINLNTDVGLQVKEASEDIKANSAVGVSPSINALDIGLIATTV